MWSEPEKGEITVIINADGSVYPFMCIFDPRTNDGDHNEDELLDGIRDILEKHGRKLGTFYSKVMGWCMILHIGKRK
jgi:hypothetical protein